MSHRHNELIKRPKRFGVLKGYNVFAVEFVHGWCWSRTAEEGQPEPSPRWFGPFATEYEAQEAVRQDARKKWRMYKSGKLV